MTWCGITRLPFGWKAELVARKRGRVAQKQVASLARFLVLGRVISLSCPPVHRSSRVHPSLQDLGSVGKGGRLPQHKDPTTHPASVLFAGTSRLCPFFLGLFRTSLLVPRCRLIVTIQLAIIICTHLFHWSHHRYFTLHRVVAVHTVLVWQAHRDPHGRTPLFPSPSSIVHNPGLLQLSPASHRSAYC